VPGIAPLIALISAQDGCLLARMSGSGGTCFGVFATAQAARDAASALAQENPGWWVQDAAILP
jgi:4-diphosphocytidyl-2-C-methyl-D-erythritol kinase